MNAVAWYKSEAKYYYINIGAHDIDRLYSKLVLIHVGDFSWQILQPIIKLHLSIGQLPFQLFPFSNCTTISPPFLQPSSHSYLSISSPIPSPHTIENFMCVSGFPILFLCFFSFYKLDFCKFSRLVALSYWIILFKLN